MVLEGFRHIPLVDDDDRPVAVVSMRNLIEYLSDFFNRDVLNLPPVLSQNLNPEILMMKSSENWDRCDGTELLLSPKIG